MKKKRKLMRTIYLDVEQIERLRKLSVRTRVPQAVYIREGIDLVLSKHLEKKERRKVLKESRKIKVPL